MPVFLAIIQEGESIPCSILSIFEISSFPMHCRMWSLVPVLIYCVCFKYGVFWCYQ